MFAYEGEGGGRRDGRTTKGEVRLREEGSTVDEEAAAGAIRMVEGARSD
jgi:hypothetical protein